MNILAEYADENLFINPAEKFAKLIKNDLGKSLLTSENGKFEETFYVSDKPKQFVESSRMFYDIKTEPILQSLNHEIK